MPLEAKKGTCRPARRDMANAPQMSDAKPTLRNGKGGGFDLDDGHDKLDGDFTRRGAA